MQDAQQCAQYVILWERQKATICMKVFGMIHKKWTKVLFWEGEHDGNLEDLMGSRLSVRFCTVCLYYLYINE